MSKRVISNLDLKIKLTNEYLRNGGVEKIFDVDLLDDIIKVEFYDGKANPETVSSRLNAFMLAILGSHYKPPFFHQEYISEYASIYQKASCFDQTNIDTEEDFDRIYDEYKAKREILFRGQKEAKWRLYSKLQRYWNSDKWFEKGISYQTLLNKLVAFGKEEFGSNIVQILDKNHIDTKNDISVLGYLQHHSCPTPLLDWTFSFKNALFFAIENIEEGKDFLEIEQYCSVYFIEENLFDGGNLRLQMEEIFSDEEQPRLLKIISNLANDEEQRKEMEEKFKGRQLIDRKLIEGSGLISHMTRIDHFIEIPFGYFSDKDKEANYFFSLNNSKNILNQEGVFTWNNDASKPLELLGIENYLKHIKEDEQEDDYRFCKCFNINKKLANYIRKKIELEGITREYVYPTPDINTWCIYEKIKKDHK